MATHLKSAREERGLTTYAVAAAVGINQSHYSRVENGEAGASPDLARRLAMYFGMTVTEHQILYPQEHLATVADGPTLQSAEEDAARESLRLAITQGATGVLAELEKHDADLHSVILDQVAIEREVRLMARPRLDLEGRPLPSSGPGAG